MSPAQSQKQQKFFGMVHALQKGDLKNASPSVKKAAHSISPEDAKKFASTKRKGLPVRKESTIGSIIGQYNEYGSQLKKGISLGELAEELMQIAEFAEQMVMSEADDWFDGHTIKRNMKEMKGYVNEFSKIASEHDKLMQRATALYDDMGRVLERYFEIHDMPTEDLGYDSTGDDKEDLFPDNAPKHEIPPDEASQMAHEDMYTDRDVADYHDKDDEDMANISGDKGDDPMNESGERFKKLVNQLKNKDESLETEYKVNDPAALAAWIGRKKYGKEKFQHMAAAGKKHHDEATEPKLGTGTRFQKLVRKLAAKEGMNEQQFMDEYQVHDPKALAAWIGRKKYGKEKFQKMAAAGRKHEGAGYERAKNLSERLVSLARRKLEGENLSRFDTLPRETQIRAAWKIVR